MKGLTTSALLLLALVLPATATAYDFAVNGIYYNIVNSNEASVTFKGYDNVQTGHYSGDVIIPETVSYHGVTYTVTGIGNSAFSNCTDPVTVTIPKTVISICTFSFSGSSGMTSIKIDSDNPKYDSRNNCNAIIITKDNRLIAGCKNTVIPNTVTIIGNGAFWGCNSLTSVTIPNSVTTIEVQGFAYCRGLTSLTIPKSVTFIDQFAFSCCTGLTSITVDNDNRIYDSRDNCNAIIRTEDNTLIYGCQNTIIPNSVSAIGSYAFESQSTLTSITIPNSVFYIGDHAFLDCSGLTSITLPDHLDYIGNYAFSGCSGLTSINIPRSVTYIGYNPFSSCSSLTSITVDSDNPKFDSRDNCNAVISTANNKLIVGCKSTIIPNTITGIGRSAFSYCSGLKSVTIPSTVTSIENYAFNYCNDLADVYSYITDLTNVSMGAAVFMTRIFTNRTLHVPHGTADAYHADENWYPYFSSIVEMDPAADLPGDVNGNGEVNIADVNAVFDIILGKTGYTADADVNNDGEITIADANEIIDIILGNGSSQSDPGYVDLGLPSGTLWATCNVGAESPEQYGDYFAWGETQPKDVYSWENYQWCNGTEYSLTKYNNSSDYGHVDKKMELDPDDDAAYVNQGPSWRMPSLEQIQELCNCCTWKWFQLNGVNGQLVTGPNGKSIFLPAAGGRSSQLYNTGVSSYYWTRTLCSRDTLTIESAGPGQAYIQFFRSGEWEVWYSSRYVGNTVRAVRAPQK